MPRMLDVSVVRVKSERCEQVVNTHHYFFLGAAPNRKSATNCAFGCVWVSWIGRRMRGKQRSGEWGKEGRE